MCWDLMKLWGRPLSIQSKLNVGVADEGKGTDKDLFNEFDTRLEKMYIGSLFRGLGQWNQKQVTAQTSARQCDYYSILQQMWSKSYWGHIMRSCGDGSITQQVHQKWTACV